MPGTLADSAAADSRSLVQQPLTECLARAVRLFIPTLQPKGKQHQLASAEQKQEGLTAAAGCHTTMASTLTFSIRSAHACTTAKQHTTFIGRSGLAVASERRQASPLLPPLKAGPPPWL
jgi:hypothetical protein